MVNNYFRDCKLNWQQCWQNKSFRIKLFIGFIFITAILLCFPFFFQYIEQREGVVISDAILNAVPSLDVSVPIFMLIWSCAFLMLLAVIKNPEILLTFLIAYIILCILRIISIVSFPLQAPPELVPLIDPLSNHFYGVPFITKDLFFSGHASTLFLMYLCQRNKVAKYYILLSSLSVAVLVLVQHIHYTIDVIFAFPFAFLCYRFAKYLMY